MTTTLSRVAAVATAASHPQPRPETGRWRFAVAAEADPGMMPRLLEVFAKRGLVPDRWAARVDGADDPVLSVRCAVGGLTEGQAASVTAFLDGVPGVIRVVRRAA
jgi:hypothetical protein